MKEMRNCNMAGHQGRCRLYIDPLDASGLEVRVGKLCVTGSVAHYGSSYQMKIAKMAWRVTVMVLRCDGMSLPRDFREHCVCYERICLADMIVFSEESCRFIVRYWVRKYPDVSVHASWNEISEID